MQAPYQASVYPPANAPFPPPQGSGGGHPYGGPPGPPGPPAFGNPGGPGGGQAPYPPPQGPGGPYQDQRGPPPPNGQGYGHERRDYGGGPPQRGGFSDRGGRGGFHGGRAPPFMMEDQEHNKLIEQRVERERPCRTLFIRNIAYDASVAELRKQFDDFGEVKTFFDLIGNRGMIFVTFYDVRAAEQAKDGLQSVTVAGRPIDVHYSLPRPEEASRPCGPDANQGSLRIVLRDSKSGQPIDDTELRRVFSEKGEVKRVKPRPDHPEERLVEFYDSRAVLKAFKELRDAPFQDGKLEVHYEWDVPTVPIPDGAMVARGSSRFLRGTRGRGGRGGFDESRGGGRGGYSGGALGGYDDSGPPPRGGPGYDRSGYRERSRSPPRRRYDDAGPPRRDGPGGYDGRRDDYRAGRYDDDRRDYGPPPRGYPSERGGYGGDRGGTGGGGGGHGRYEDERRDYGPPSGGYPGGPPPLGTRSGPPGPPPVQLPNDDRLAQAKKVQQLLASLGSGPLGGVAGPPPPQGGPPAAFSPAHPQYPPHPPPPGASPYGAPSAYGQGPPPPQQYSYLPPPSNGPPGSGLPPFNPAYPPPAPPSGPAAPSPYGNYGAPPPPSASIAYPPASPYGAGAPHPAPQQGPSAGYGAHPPPSHPSLGSAPPPNASAGPSDPVGGGQQVQQLLALLASQQK